MSDSNSPRSAASPATLDPRVKKILERIYGVDGVAQARVWCWTNQVAIGVLGSGAESTLVGRVTDACRGLEEEGETWTIGLLGD